METRRAFVKTVMNLQVYESAGMDKGKEEGCVA
jgi:hypothetical protein